MQLIFLLLLFQPLVVVTFYIAGTTSLTKKHFFPRLLFSYRYINGHHNWLRGLVWGFISEARPVLKTLENPKKIKVLPPSHKKPSHVTDYV